MYEITFNDSEKLENFINCGKAYKNGVYDFTFENKYIIYHAPIRCKIDYMALDMMTGKNSVVTTVNNENLYDDADYYTLIPAILDSLKYCGDKRSIDRFSGDPIEIIDSIFCVVLSSAGYSVRKEQIELSKNIFRGFTGKQISICEAEVGTGKTLAYLVAGIVARQYLYRNYDILQPITITTSSIELQRALVEKEIPNLSNLLIKYHIIEEPLKVAVRKGKDHYFCLKRFNDHYKNISKYPNTHSKDIETLNYIKNLPLGIDLDRYRINNALKHSICVDSQCVSCSLQRDCIYHRYMNRVFSMTDLDFQVTNHNLYLLHCKNAHPDFPPLLRNSAYVVIDEAHKFKEAAQDVFGETFSEKTIVTYANTVKNLCRVKKRNEEYLKLHQNLLKLNNELFEDIRKMHNRYDKHENGAVIHLNYKQREKLIEMHTTIDQLEKLRLKKNQTLIESPNNIMKSIKEMLSQNNIVWLEVDENNVLILRSTPRNINEILKAKVWDREVSHVLTSGTMSDGNNFEYFKKNIGLECIPKHLLLETQIPSPFDYKNNTRLYIPQSMPAPDNSSKEYIDAVANECEKLINATDGRTAILFTSYRVLHAVYEELYEKIKNYEIFKMTRSNKTAISDFKKSQKGVIFASGSMWEGVDCIGDGLSSVIIVRLPFPMRSILMEERKKECKNISNFVDEFCAPSMIIKLRQGVGRLVRCETDTGVISILDSRVKSAAYADKIETALNKYPVIHSINEVSEFMKQVKAPEYFE